MELNLYPIVSDYYLDNSFISLIIGPVGSGKTVGSIAKLDRLMYEQKESPDGIRYSRWAVVRNTYRELQDTTIKSFESFFGDLLKINRADFTGIYEHDGIKAEFLFRSLDKPQDMSKLLSLDLTGAYLNELRELASDVLTHISLRVGRYPSKINGGATNSMVIADTNAFPDDHWIYNLFLTDKRPENHKLFLQPPAILDDNSVNPIAENLTNLPFEYYRGQIKGKPEDFIDVMIKVKFIPMKTGKPVYPEYSQKIHYIDHAELSPPSRSIPLICSGDNGRWSGYLVAQKDTLGRIVIYDELLSDDVNLTDFSQIIKDHLLQNYPGHEIETWIDPFAANQRGQVSDMTMFKVYNNAGLNPRVSQTRSVDTMVEAVKKKLGLIIVGQPAILISSKCVNLIRGLNGGYQYERVNISGERYKDKPDKGKFSHICNALEYLIDGAGGSRELLASTKYKNAGPIKINTNWSVF